MAAAARLTDPLRTSPAAKIPGQLVSRNNGALLSWASRAGGMSLPVSRKPWLSWASWPASHWVRGLAPMKTNSPRTARSDSAAWPARRIRTLTGVGVSSGAAVSAVLTYRLSTYWLPVIPGWVCLRVLQRRDYL